jgi:hypothetical protein
MGGLLWGFACILYFWQFRHTLPISQVIEKLHIFFSISSFRPASKLQHIKQ